MIPLITVNKLEPMKWYEIENVTMMENGAKYGTINNA